MAIIAFQDVLLWKVGHHALDFRTYPALIDFVIGQNFIQVVGLVYVVVHYLFPTPEKVAQAMEKRLASQFAKISSQSEDPPHKDE